MQKERMVEKLAAVKNLAERGVGGEKETALRMYEELKEKYGISEAEIEAVEAEPDTEAEKEYSDIVFLLWVIANNLDDEMKVCRDCPERKNQQEICMGCATDENINDLKRQYEELKERLESGAG